MELLHSWINVGNDLIWGQLLIYLLIAVGLFFTLRMGFMQIRLLPRGVKEMLGGRIRAPDRFCSLQFDATNGANGLFVDMVHLIPARYDSMTEETRILYNDTCPLCRFEIDHYRDRASATGAPLAFDALDRAIKMIRESQGKADAAEKLMKAFGLDDIQTEAILEAQL